MFHDSETSGCCLTLYRQNPGRINLRSDDHDSGREARERPKELGERHIRHISRTPFFSSSSAINLQLNQPHTSFPPTETLFSPHHQNEGFSHRHYLCHHHSGSCCSHCRPSGHQLQHQQPQREVPPPQGLICCGSQSRPSGYPARTYILHFSTPCTILGDTNWCRLEIHTVSIQAVSVSP